MGHTMPDNEVYEVPMKMIPVEEKPEPRTPKPIVLEKPDFLEMQNLHLKLQVTELKEKQLTAALQDNERLFHATRVRLLENRTYLEKKYGIDLTQVMFDENGTAIPK